MMAGTVSANAASRLWQSEPGLIVNPSNVVIKVGNSARVYLTLTNLHVKSETVCFSVEGFPTSGFITSAVPACANLQSSGRATSNLTVEATTAAAPQSFTAFVVATSGNWTMKAPISIIVEPAMPAWIPWSVILIFVLILIVPIAIKIEKTKPSRRKQSRVQFMLPIWSS
jgi:hypothetical protein